MIKPNDPGPASEQGSETLRIPGQSHEKGDGAVAPTAPPNTGETGQATGHDSHEQASGEVHSETAVEPSGPTGPRAWLDEHFRRQGFEFDHKRGKWWWMPSDHESYHVCTIRGGQVIGGEHDLIGLDEGESVSLSELAYRLSEGQVGRQANIDLGPIRFSTLSDIEPQQVRWMWHPILPQGKLVLLQGHPGLGKSFVTLDLAARLSTGRAMPGAKDALMPPSDVLVIASEDGVADTMKPRIMAAGGDDSRIHVVTEIRAGNSDRATMFSLDVAFQILRDQLTKSPDIKLVIIDPISEVLGSKDGNSNQDMRSLLAPMASFADEAQVTFLLVNHLNKGEGPRIQRGMGSMGLPAVCRCVCEIVRDPDDPAARHLQMVKNNLAEDCRRIRFGLEPGEVAAKVVWDSEFSTGVPEIIEEAVPSKLEQAERFLGQTLAAGPGLASKITEEATELGISKRTMERAKKTLGVRVVKRSERWCWMLPGSSDSPAA